MKFEVGKNYTTRNGTEVRCLATDSAYGEYPIILMELKTGSTYRVLENGRCSKYDDLSNDILPQTKKVEGWISYKPFGTYLGTLYIDEKIAKAYSVNGCKIVKIQFEIQED